MDDLSTQLREYFDATASPVEVEEVVGDVLWVPPRQTPPKRRTTPNWAYGIAAMVAVLVLVLGVALLAPGGNEDDVVEPTPPNVPQSPFVGTWVTNDHDGSTSTAAFDISDEGVVDMVVVDDSASVCSGAPSTMSGTGSLEGDMVLVIPEPLYTCDDGAIPEVLSGPPLEEQLRNLTFTYNPGSDTLTDTFGLVWTRESAVEPTPTTMLEGTPTTVASDGDTVIDPTIEAAVAAFYSGDVDRAAELFELSDRTDEEIRRESAYQAAIGGRLSVGCTESAPGRFNCTMEYHNALIDAAAAVAEDPDGFASWWGIKAWFDSGVEVVVEDDVITTFVFPEYPIVNIAMGSYLASEGRLEGYEDCAFGPLTESCAVIQLENLDAWTDWQEAWNRRDADTPALEARILGVIDSAIEAWYGGDCLGAHFLAGAMFYVDGVIADNGYRDGANDLCPSSAGSSQTIEYESILGADVNVEGCPGGGRFGGGFDWYRESDDFALYLVQQFVTCEVHYSNAMNTAVRKPPSVTVRDDLLVSLDIGVLMTGDRDVFHPWYAQGAYPEDTELRESFKLFAESGELREEFAAASCATERSPDCARLIMDNLDDWAVWHQTNS